MSSSYTPGSSGSYAHDWSNIRISGRHFVDKHGRVCHLRGVNLSGSSKTPANDNNETFPADAEIATFVGRPIPLEEAHEHFSRLRRWGFTFIRFLVTWEAVEHAGPGIYDTEYLKYIREILQLLPKYGMVAFVALHQDVWSRYSGGSGAPAWTLEKIGFDLNELVSTGAAWLNGVKGGGHTEDEMGFWSTGYQKLAASTMATLFWAGDTFAPKLTVEYRGQQMNAQQFLQTTYLDMFEQIVKAVGDLDGVIGFEMMNEPHRGYIDLKSLHSFDYNTDLHLGPIPSAFQSFQLGAGYPTEVDVWSRSFPMPTQKSHKVVLNPEGKSVWKGKAKKGDVGEEGKGQCIWETHGVWGWSKDKKEAVVLRENYFVKHPMTGGKIDWYTDFFYPFMTDWSKRVHAHSPSKMLFIEIIPNEFCPPTFLKDVRPKNMVYAPHWYDLKALFEKAYGDFTVNVQGLSRGMFPLFTFYWGHKGARNNYAHQISNIVHEGHKNLADIPVVIGECGVPMDMNNREAFETDDFTWQARMMDAMMTGLEKALVPFTLWNYNPYNTDTDGDFWNGENFSWFSRGRALPASWLDFHQSSPTLDNGGRMLNVIVRPYPGKTAGIPGKFEYEVTTSRVIYEWNDSSSSSIYLDDLKAKETEIFIPSMLTQGRKLVVSGLGEEDRCVHDQERQTLFIVTKNKGNHRVEISVTPPPRPMFFVNDFWSDWGGTVAAVGVVLVALFAGIVALYLRA
ncbi:glycoside hydrolase family 5 protein [Marasmius fiardii PR-910]|nr:glycoside hydrolase family 5 protein [Marasmius fiardii PR-910]